MTGIDTLMKKVRERLNLNCYTPWEHKFLSSLVTQYDRSGRLSEKQIAKLKEVVLVRYIQGETPHVDAKGHYTGAAYPIDRLKKGSP